jgi:rRNA maturation endonuclease Nob1
MKQIQGPWRIQYRCVGCKRVMSRRTKMYSFGVCPACGYTVPGTICDTLDFSVAPVYANWFMWMLGIVKSWKG